MNKLLKNIEANDLNMMFEILLNRWVRVCAHVTIKFRQWFYKSKWNLKEQYVLQIN